MDIIHRILSGNIRGGSPHVNRGELVAAGLFVLVWFAIDVIQFADFVWSKFSPPQSALCLPIGTPMLDMPDRLCTPIPGTNTCWQPVQGIAPLTQNNGAR